MAASDVSPKWQRIDLPRIQDVRGSLSFVEAGSHCPFNFCRIYYIYDVPAGERRAAHAHKALNQLFICISGSFTLFLDDGTHRETIRMSRPDVGIFVDRMVWRDLLDFSSGAVCLVLASQHYEEADYIRDYDEFLAVAGANRSLR